MHRFYEQQNLLHSKLLLLSEQKPSKGGWAVEREIEAMGPVCDAQKLGGSLVGVSAPSCVTTSEREGGAALATPLLSDSGTPSGDNGSE